MLGLRRLAGALLLLTCLLIATAWAQQTSSAAQLHEQIRKMLAVEHDATTPPEVRALNRTLLRERRAQLRELLQRRLDATLKYRADFKAALTPDLDASIRKTINELIREIHTLDAARSVAPARTAHAAEERAPETTVATTTELETESVAMTAATVTDPPQSGAA